MTNLFITLICIASHGDAAPIQNPPDGLTNNSKEVWMALVTNIAPLLILLGEKHVKAYFKSMSTISQHLLYAASPIGLITAATTLVRLYGPSPLRRLIGRQYETRADVLADVTSASEGDVFWLLKARGLSKGQGASSHARLEQSTSPDSEKEAQLMLSYSCSCNARSIKNLTFQQELGKLLRTLDEHNTVIGGTNLHVPSAERGAWMSGLTVVEASGEDCHESARAAALTVFKARFTYRFIGKVKETIQPAHPCSPEVGQCTVHSLAYVGLAGISPILTIGSSRISPLFESLRTLLAFIFLIVEVGVVYFNWRTDRNAVTTGLLATGVGCSFFACWLIAFAIDLCTEEEYINLQDLQPFLSFSCFYSRSDRARYMIFNKLRKAIISSPSNQNETDLLRESRYDGPMLTLFAIVAYLALYSGLRAAKWWVSLAIIGLAGIAAVLRTLLDADIGNLRPTADLPDPLSGPPPKIDNVDWILDLWNDLPSVGDLRVPDATMTSLSHPLSYRARLDYAARTQKPGLQERNTSMGPRGAAKPSGAYTLPYNHHCWTIVLPERYRMGNHSPEQWEFTHENNFISIIYVAFFIASKIKNDNLSLQEILAIEDDERMDAPLYLRSEFPAGNALLQQALEVGIPGYDARQDHFTAILGALRAWASQAFRLRSSLLVARKTPSTHPIPDTKELSFLPTISEDSLASGFVSMDDVSPRACTARFIFRQSEPAGFTFDSYPNPEEVQARERVVTLLSRSYFSRYWMLWMAIKLTLALSPSHIEFESFWDRHGWIQKLKAAVEEQDFIAFTLDMASQYIGHMKALGCLVPNSRSDKLYRVNRALVDDVLDRKWHRAEGKISYRYPEKYEYARLFVYPSPMDEYVKRAVQEKLNRWKDSRERTQLDDQQITRNTDSRRTGINLGCDAEERRLGSIEESRDNDANSHANCPPISDD